MSLLGAVTPSEAPQQGVKRPLQGKPTAVPNNLPAFRGRDVAPGGNVKVPKLNQGNKPNRQTNISIPYQRVCPLEFLSGWTGRLAPGDVAFILKYPPGFLKSLPNANNATGGTATMSRVVGVDGVNRMLHGSGNPQGWKVGVNVLFVNDPNTPAGQVAATGPQVLKRKTQTMQEFFGALPLPTAASDLANYARFVPDETLRTTFLGAPAGRGLEWNDARGFAEAAMIVEYNLHAKEVFRLDVLENTRVDGIVQSNDEPHSFTSNGSRDAVVFNNVIQGPTLVNNGYLLYDPEANPGYNVNGGGKAQQHGALPLRTVEAHPRGSIEGGYHLGGSGHGRPGVVGSQTWLGHGQYDYVAAFTGTYTTYPGQMFDRHVQPMNSLYLGLRAHEMSTGAKLKITKDDGTRLFPDTALGRQDAAAAQCYFYQYMPFASRKAWLCQHVQEEIRKGLTQATPVAAEATVARINNSLVNHNKGAKKSRFDEDIFDAVRTDDLANMVGAWHLGRVLDIKSQRLTAYDGGPSDTGFSLMVDVQIGWRNAFHTPNGAGGEMQQRADAQIVDHTSRGFNPATNVQYARSENEQDALVRREIDQHNAQFPSLRATLGNVVGFTWNLKFAQNTFLGGAPVSPAFAIAKTIGVRWPVLAAAWDALWDAVVVQRVWLRGQNMALRVADQMRIAGANAGDVWKASNRQDERVALSLAALQKVLVDVHVSTSPPEIKALASYVRSLRMRMLFGGADPTADQITSYENRVAGLFAGLLGPAGAATKTQITREAFFYAFAGLRVSDKAEWYKRGPAAFPTLSQADDGPMVDLDDAQLDEITTLAGLHEWSPGDTFVIAEEGGVGEEEETETGALAEEPMAVIEEEPASGSSSGVDVGTAASSLASSWHSVDDAAMPEPGPEPESAPEPTRPAPTSASAAGKAPAPAPASTLAPQQAAATAAAARSAPITAAAMTSATAAKKRVGKSPTRARGGAVATATATAAAATTAAATVVPAAAATATTAPLLPTLAPTPAPTAGAANPVAAAARRRSRMGLAPSGSTVDSVFDRHFGSGLQREIAGEAPDTGALFDNVGSPPASPTPSSGSEQGSGAGPKTFRRTDGSSGRPR